MRKKRNTIPNLGGNPNFRHCGGRFARCAENTAHHKTGALLEFLLKCPFLEQDGESFIYVDALPNEPTSYGFSVLPSPVWHKRYVDGGGIQQIEFVFRTSNVYDKDAAYSNTANIEFFERFCDWLENNKDDFLEVVPLTGGYCFDVEDSGSSAVYQIQCRALFT